MFISTTILFRLNNIMFHTQTYIWSSSCQKVLKFCLNIRRIIESIMLLWLRFCVVLYVRLMWAAMLSNPSYIYNIYTYIICVFPDKQLRHIPFLSVKQIFDNFELFANKFLVYFELNRSIFANPNRRNLFIFAHLMDIYAGIWWWHLKLFE